MMDCLDVFLISSKGGIKKRAVATGYKSNWVASYLHTSKPRAVPLADHTCSPPDLFGDMRQMCVVTLLLLASLMALAC